MVTPTPSSPSPSPPSPSSRPVPFPPVSDQFVNVTSSRHASKHPVRSRHISFPRVTSPDASVEQRWQQRAAKRRGWGGLVVSITNFPEKGRAGESHPPSSPLPSPTLPVQISLQDSSPAPLPQQNKHCSSMIAKDKAKGK